MRGMAPPVPPDSGKLYRVVVDPGVLVSARITFGGRGAPSELLMAWFEGRFDMIASEALLAELEEVLLRTKFRRYISIEEVARYLDLIRRAAPTESEPSLPSETFTPDPKDEYLVALARASGADFLVSGDPHLTRLENPRPPTLTPRAFLDML